MHTTRSEHLRGLERVDDRTWGRRPTLLVYKPETYRLTFFKTEKAMSDPALCGTRREAGAGEESAILPR